MKKEGPQGTVLSLLQNSNKVESRTWEKDRTFFWELLKKNTKKLTVLGV